MNARRRSKAVVGITDKVTATFKQEAIALQQIAITAIVTTTAADDDDYINYLT